MIIKILIILVMFAILFSLFRSLYFLTTEKADSKRTVQNLTWRIGLSVLFFLLLLAGVYFDVLEPHGLPDVPA